MLRKSIGTLITEVSGECPHCNNDWVIVIE